MLGGIDGHAWKAVLTGQRTGGRWVGGDDGVTDVGDGLTTRSTRQRNRMQKSNKRTTNNMDKHGTSWDKVVGMTHDGKRTDDDHDDDDRDAVAAGGPSWRRMRRRMKGKMGGGG